MSSSPAPVPVRDRISRWIKDELKPQQLVASFNAAVMLCMLELIILLSLSALIFKGQLAAQLPYAIGSFLVGNALLIMTVSMLSSYSGSIASVQDAPAVILAVAVSSLAAGLPKADGWLFPTVALLIAGSTLTLGLVYLLIGSFKLGGLIRFVPYSVVGGFLAATGWLLTLGGIDVATGLPSEVGKLQPAALARWLPALLLGVFFMLALRRWTSPLAPTALILAAVAVFYAVMLLRGYSPSRLSAEGWLLAPVSQDTAWHLPVAPQSLTQINWHVLLSAIPIAAPAILISLLGLLLNASGLELIARRDIDLNRELIATGAANLLAGFVGGLMGYHAISSSALNQTIGKGKRLPGVLTALLLVLIAVAGTALLAFFPRVLLGGLLIYIGLELLYEWVVKAWFAFPRLEFGVVISILVIVALWGFFWGVGVGLVLAVILFVVRYSRVSVVRYEASGAVFRSRVSRSMWQEELLEAHGDQLIIYRLQGYIFFGTANNLFERVRERIRRAATRVRFVLLDFEQVTGLDSTGLLSFRKLLQFTRASEIELIMTGLTGHVRDQLLADGFTDHTAGLRLLADLDRGVERCEDQLIAELETEDPSHTTLEALLPAGLPNRTAVAALIRGLQRRQVAAGEHIIRQGALPDDLFFLESGQLTAQLEQDGREPVRLETMHDGRMVGEVGFFLGTRRSASVVADRPSVVYVLTRAEWAELGRNDPRTALLLSHLVLYLLSHRVAHLTRVVDTLQG